MSLRLNGSTSGYSELTAPAVAGDQTFTLPGTGGTLDRLNRAGNILQVVNARLATEVSSSSATFADTGLSASITPASSSNKILIYVSMNGVAKNNTQAYVALRLLRGSTVLYGLESAAAFTGTTNYNYVGGASTTYLDSPATASSVTYKIQIANPNGSGAGYINKDASIGDGTSSTLTLLEVAG